MYTKQERMMQMTFTKLPKSITAENHYRRRAACNADSACKMDYPRSAPGRAGNFCRSQQGGQKLADTLALLADFAGEICVGA